MKMISKLAIGLGCALTCMTVAHSAIPNRDTPKTSLGPALGIGITKSITDITAYSLTGELGARNLRFDGTFGWSITDNQRLKVSAELLKQRIDYPFFSGNQYEWVSQGAVGAYYQYSLSGFSLNPQFDINGYLSHAPSQNLDPISGTLTNAGVLQSYTDQRRIAGSNAGGISPGITIEPWVGTKAGVDLNYDNVRYDKIYSPSEDAKGLGGTVRLNQVVTDNIIFGVSAAFRQPFNNYQVNLTWNEFGRWSFGVDGAYTKGKDTLPTTYNVMFSANCLLDKMETTTTAQKETAAKFIAGASDSLVNWVSKPAVYMPQVLAVADDHNVICGQIPTVTGSIASQTNALGTTTFATASAFSPSSGLTYSIALSPAAAGANSVTINSTTGVVTVVNGGTAQTINATITAANACGSVSTSTTITIQA